MCSIICMRMLQGAPCPVWIGPKCSVFYTTCLSLGTTETGSWPGKRGAYQPYGAKCEAVPLVTSWIVRVKIKGTWLVLTGLTVSASTSTRLGTFLRPPNLKVARRFCRHCAAIAAKTTALSESLIFPASTSLKLKSGNCVFVQCLLTVNWSIPSSQNDPADLFGRPVSPIEYLGEVAGCRKLFARGTWRGMVSVRLCSQSTLSWCTSFSKLVADSPWKRNVWHVCLSLCTETMCKILQSAAIHTEWLHMVTSRIARIKLTVWCCGCWWIVWRSGSTLHPSVPDTCGFPSGSRTRSLLASALEPAGSRPCTSWLLEGKIHSIRVSNWLHWHQLFVETSYLQLKKWLNKLPAFIVSRTLVKNIVISIKNHTYEAFNSQFVDLRRLELKQWRLYRGTAPLYHVNLFLPSPVCDLACWQNVNATFIVTHVWRR